MFNGDKRVVGKCSQCGGVVSIPTYAMTVNRVVPSCESCGAVADETAGLPVIPTVPTGGYRPTPTGYDKPHPRRHRTEMCCARI